MTGGLLIAVSATYHSISLIRTIPPADDDVRTALVAMLKQAAPKEHLEREIASALDRDAPEEAEDYLDVADLIQVPIDPVLRTRFVEETSGLRALGRDARRISTGFVTGEGEGTAGIAAAIASDLTVVGDIRDLAVQTSRIVRDEPVDEWILGLSIAGVSISAATVATAGGALPAKVSIALVKLAKKTGTLTVRFEKELSQIVARIIDMPTFRQATAGIPWYRLDDLVSAARSHATRVDTVEVQRVLASVTEINRVTSPTRTLAILRHVDDVKDLQDAERAAKVLGKPVSGAFRLSGKRVFAAMARAFHMSMKLFLSLITAILGAISFLLGVIMKVASVIRMWRKFRASFWSVKARAGSSSPDHEGRSPAIPRAARNGFE